MEQLHVKDGEVDKSDLKGINDCWAKKKHFFFYCLFLSFYFIKCNSKYTVPMLISSHWDIMYNGEEPLSVFFQAM